MPSFDAFAFRQSGLNEFLFAPVGTEANGMTLSLVSVFARRRNDPWLEADRLAKLRKSEATESLARSITSMPTSIWPLQAATAMKSRQGAYRPPRAAWVTKEVPDGVTSDTNPILDHLQAQSPTIR